MSCLRLWSPAEDPAVCSVSWSSWCEPQQEPLESLSPWVYEQWSLGWAALWISASADLSGQGESVCWRQGENTPSWTPRCLWQPVGMALWLPPSWAVFERVAVIAGASHVKVQWIVVWGWSTEKSKEFNCWGYQLYFICDSRAIYLLFQNCGWFCGFFSACLKNFNVKKIPLGVVNNWVCSSDSFPPRAAILGCSLNFAYDPLYRPELYFTSGS